MADATDATPAAATEEVAKVEETAVEAPADAPVEAPAAAEEEKPAAEEKAEVIYMNKLQNRVVVARTHPTSYYLDRARRILRTEEQMVVTGRGQAISIACTIVELLKRRKLAETVKISTGMNVEPFFNDAGEPQWTQPVAQITFTLKRGELGEFISDFHQRKIIEVFEGKDPKYTGTLSFAQVEALKMPENFRANDEQKARAAEFLQSQKEKSLDLPNFIKYASIVIHPLLKDKVFKNILAENYKIGANKNAAPADPPAEAETEAVQQD